MAQTHSHYTGMTVNSYAGSDCPRGVTLGADPGLKHANTLPPLQDQRDKAIEAGQALQSVPATWERSKTADVDSSEEGEDDEPTLAELPPLASAATT